MAVRRFDGVDDVLVCGTGTLSAETGSDITVAVIMRRGVDSAWHAILTANTSADSYSGWGLLLTDVGKPYIGNDAAGPNTMRVMTSDGWVLLAVTKVAGTATPRFHKYVFSTDTWTHENGSTTQADGSGPGASGKFKFATFDTGADWLNGDIAVGGIFQSVLSDGALEALDSTLQAWVDALPAALWPLNQASTSDPVEDITGNGANQTAIAGTTVVTGDDPPGFDFTLGGPPPVLEEGPQQVIRRSNLRLG